MACFDHVEELGRRSTARRCSWWIMTELRKNYRAVPQAPAAGAGLLRGEGQPRSPAIVRTLYKAGASFDVASMPEFDDRPREHQGPAGQGAAGLHLGQDHLRQPDQGHRDARGTGPVQAAGDLRQRRGDPQDPEARAPRRPGPAAAGAEHRRDGGALLQVRRHARRGRRPDARGATTRGSAVEGLCFHVGSQTTNFDNYVQALNLAAGIFKEAEARGLEAETPRHRRRLPRPLRRPGQALQGTGRGHQRRTRPPLPQAHRDPRRAGPLPGAPPPPRSSPRSSARPSATASPATTSTTASTTPTPASSSTTASTR